MSTGAELHLIIANKNYSSWSFRPWLSMKAAGIEFRETVAPFDEPNHNQHFLEFSPSKKVPVLQHGDLTLWESLAIMEYVADLHPDCRLWPADVAQRGMARAVSHEMHGGFGALRAECPMNMRRKIAPMAVSEGVRADVSRIETIWAECLEASGGPFLFGEFSNADAMYAPVVNRFEIYELSSAGHVEAYARTMKSLPAWREWAEASKAEPWTVEEEEV
ncbi:MAG: glutathione S-transferase family protein [Alphaproteobacteria bacterium]|nr:glutathione S-transferase family protein [Alphaproteobacteria bacterium]